MNDIRRYTNQGVPVVIKNLLIVNALVFIATIFNKELWTKLAIFYPMSPFFEPYQLVTNMFTHAPLPSFHFFINMLALWSIGSTLERMVGPQRTLKAYIVCGVFGTLLHLFALGVNVYIDMGSFAPNINMVSGNVAAIYGTPSLGASGAISGMAMAFTMLYPDAKMMIIPIPVPIAAKKLMIGFVVFSLVAGIFNLVGGIAHFAHLGGAIAGFILVKIWMQGRNRLY